MTKYYPLCVQLAGRKCLVVGAGSVALRKIQDLLLAGADITVVTRAAHPSVLELAESGDIKLINKPYQKEDLQKGDYFLVIAATNNDELHAQIYQEAEKRRILCNAVDDINYCSFIIPAVIERGDLSIGISTNGKTPFLSRAIRLYLEDEIGPQWGELVEYGKILRRRNKEGLASPEERAIFSDFWASRLGVEIKSGDRDKALQYIRDYIKEFGGNGN